MFLNANKYMSKQKMPHKVRVSKTPVSRAINNFFCIHLVEKNHENRQQITSSILVPI